MMNCAPITGVCLLPNAEQSPSSVGSGAYAPFRHCC